MENIPTILQNQKEFFQLLQLYRELNPKKVLEIGVKNGGTLWYWISNAAPSIVVAVDDCKQENAAIDSGEWANKNRINLFKFIKGDSSDWEVVDEINSFGPYDFVFIDGDHSYGGVRSDWENYGDASVVAFHDIVPHDEHDNGPYKLWQEIKPHYSTLEFVEDWDSKFGGIGVVLRNTELCAILAA